METTVQKDFEFSGTKFQLLIINYTNSTFINVTDTDSFGKLVSVSSERVPVAAGLTESVFDTKVLLGQDQEELHASARLIAGKLLEAGLFKPLLFSFGIKKLDAKFTKALAEELKQLKWW